MQHGLLVRAIALWRFSPEAFQSSVAQLDWLMKRKYTENAYVWGPTFFWHIVLLDLMQIASSHVSRQLQVRAAIFAGPNSYMCTSTRLYLQVHEAIFEGPRSHICRSTKIYLEVTFLWHRCQIYRKHTANIRCHTPPCPPSRVTSVTPRNKKNVL